MGVAGDVLGVTAGAWTLTELSDDDLIDIATGLTRVMTAYNETGIYSFNMNFFPGAENDEFSRLHLLFSSRTFFNQALGTPDVGAIQKLFNENVCMAYPEEINNLAPPVFRVEIFARRVERNTRITRGRTTFRPGSVFWSHNSPRLSLLVHLF